MASKKRQAYREWDTKAIVSYGKEITSDQINILNQTVLCGWVMQPIIEQIRDILDEEHLRKANIILSQWYDSQRRLLIMDQVKCIRWLVVYTSQIKAAIHDLFQWSRVEKIRQEHTTSYF